MNLPSFKKLETYSNLGAYLSIFLLFLIGIIAIISNIFSPKIIIFCIVGWIFAIILLLIEVNFCRNLCSACLNFDKFIEMAEKYHIRKAVVYLFFSIIMFLSNIGGASILIIPAIALLLTAIFCAFSSKRKDSDGSNASSI